MLESVKEVLILGDIIAALEASVVAEGGGLEKELDRRRKLEVIFPRNSRAFSGKDVKMVGDIATCFSRLRCLLREETKRVPLKGLFARCGVQGFKKSERRGAATTTCAPSLY